MTVVETLVVGDDADVLDAHITVHLNAGVDVVIATDRGSRDDAIEILEYYSREKYLRRIPDRSSGRRLVRRER